MESKKTTDAPVKRQMFSSEELQRMEKYLELLGDRQELIEWIDDYSYFFADWSIIINEAVQEMITKKQKLSLPYDNEQEMLSNISFLFTKIAYFSGMISEWNNELKIGKELTEEMIQNRRP
jgi:hypothetical protein